MKKRLNKVLLCNIQSPLGNMVAGTTENGICFLDWPDEEGSEMVEAVIGKRYGVSKLPYAVLIDEQGKIASLGIINSREHLDSLFEAKERKVASIQDYMGKRDAVQYVEADKA